jgi:hypothetical protein
VIIYNSNFYSDLLNPLLRGVGGVLEYIPHGMLETIFVDVCHTPPSPSLEGRMTNQNNLKFLKPQNL